jgi:hypothetical protein
MATRNDSKIRNDVRRRTKELRQRIAATDVIATGTVQTRTKTCGREGCACMADPAARHGPYHEWTRRRDGRLVTTSLDDAQAALLTEAIANRREVEGLLARWEHEVEARILSEKQRNH